MLITRKTSPAIVASLILVPLSRHLAATELDRAAPLITCERKTCMVILSCRREDMSYFRRPRVYRHNHWHQIWNSLRSKTQWTLLLHITTSEKKMSWMQSRQIRTMLMFWLSTKFTQIRWWMIHACLQAKHFHDCLSGHWLRWERRERRSKLQRCFAPQEAQRSSPAAEQMIGGYRWSLYRPLHRSTRCCVHRYFTFTNRFDRIWSKILLMRICHSGIVAQSWPPVEFWLGWTLNVILSDLELSTVPVLA